MSTSLKFIIIGAGDRGRTYSRYSLLHPGEMKVIAVAEPDEERRLYFAKEFGLYENQCYASYEEVLSKPKFADAVIIATPDNMHFCPTVMAMEKGYDILLEKPISNKLEDCIKLNELNKKLNRLIGVCHVLRYAPFYVKLKEIVGSGAIGDVVTIEHLEGVGWWHQAHSYVRGNWRNTKESSPMILAKACHDMDIILWFAGSNCKKISSFGSLIHFKKENAPSGSTLRCTDGCKVEAECPYSSLKLYLNMELTGWPINTISDDLSYEGRLKALKEGPYGRCVYYCDNDAVDHQVVSIEFENSVTASFTMSAFTEPGRKIRIMGTMGEVSGDGVNIHYINFRNRKKESYIIERGGNDIDTGHDSGDYALMEAFIKAVRYQDRKYISSTLDVSVQSHIMAFAAEESMKEGKVVII